MYNIREIKLQNQQDCFSYLYLYLAGELTSCFGKKAEEMIRPAVRKFGKRLGIDAKENLKAKGLRTNLKTLAETGADTFTDPRFCFRPLCATEQVFQLETYTCPIALLWNEKHAGRLGICYCEEYYAGYFDGYSNGAAQTNVSKMLTSDTDCHCRHSVYYRPANIPKEDRNKVFTMDGRSVTLQAELKRPDCKPQESGMERRCLLFIQSMYESAKNAAAEEGICAVAMGIRRYADFLCGWLEKQAMTCEWPMNKSFLKMNLPFPLDSKDIIPECCEEVKKLLDANFYRVIRTHMESR